MKHGGLLAVAGVTAKTDWSEDRTVTGIVIALASIGLVALPSRMATGMALLAVVGVAWYELVRMQSRMLDRGHNVSWVGVQMWVELFAVLSLVLALTYLRWDVGWRVMALVIFSVFAGDIAGLGGGKGLTKLSVRHPRLKPHSLMPKVSPGKTIEGCVFDLAAAMGVAYLIATVTGLKIGIGYLLASVAIFVCVGMVGDLNESWLKRQAGVKDSGRLLNGHGGMLDRFDALCFASVAACFLAAHHWL